MHSSHTDASKLLDANWSTRLELSTPSRAPCSATMLARPVWVTTTPLGTPVEPDV